MFKVGDKVRVRSDLGIGKKYGSCYFVKPMAKYKGKTVTIAKPVDSGFYRLVEDNEGWGWDTTMLERIDTMDVEQEIAILKARLAQLEGKKDTYPCIKKTIDNCIVLFTESRKGMCLNPGGSLNAIGNCSTWWDESQFTETLTEYTVKV